MESLPATDVLLHNRLVDAEYELTLTSLRVILLGVTRLLPHTSSLDATFSVAEYTTLTGVSSHSVPTDLRAAAQELVDAELRLPTDDNRQQPRHRRQWESTRLVTAARLESRTGVFTLTFADSVAHYVSSLSRNFCKFSLQQAMTLPSKHALRWFALVKSWQGKKDEQGNYRPFILLLDDLRSRFGIAPEEYGKYSHLRARVLDDPIKQLRLHTDLCFGYRPRKKARKVVQFEITPQANTLPHVPTAAAGTDGRVLPSTDRWSSHSAADTTSGFRRLKEFVLGAAQTESRLQTAAKRDNSGDAEGYRIQQADRDVEDCTKALETAYKLDPPNPSAVAMRAKHLADAQARRLMITTSVAQSSPPSPEAPSDGEV